MFGQRKSNSRTYERKRRILGGGPKAKRICQHCQAEDHWTYECKQTTATYVKRTSRSKLLKTSSSRPKLHGEKPPESEEILKLKAELASRIRANKKRKRKKSKKKRKKRRKDSSSDSDSSSSDSDSSDSSSSDSDSSSSSDSDSSDSDSDSSQPREKKKKKEANVVKKKDIEEPADDLAGKGDGAGRFPSVSGRFPPTQTNVPYGPRVPDNVEPASLPKSSREATKEEPTINMQHNDAEWEERKVVATLKTRDVAESQAARQAVKQEKDSDSSSSDSDSDSSSSGP